MTKPSPKQLLKKIATIDKTQVTGPPDRGGDTSGTTGASTETTEKRGTSIWLERVENILVVGIAESDDGMLFLACFNAGSVVTWQS